MAVLDKGRRNVEILKQPQYSPMSVEKQVAIIYCGTKGLVKKVPVNKIHDFQEFFLHELEEKHKDVLESLRKGLFPDDVLKTLEKVASEVAKKFEV
jgi:F-type H+-transporting ATPase subunit alpha